MIDLAVGGEDWCQLDESGRRGRVFTLRDVCATFEDVDIWRRAAR